MSELLEAALLYGRWGLRVIPLAHIVDGVCSCLKGKDCDHPGKHPIIKDWTNRASSDEKQLRSWWKNWPNANIGILTGEAGRVFVLDVDDRNGGDESLFELEKKVGKLDESLIVLTGSGNGRHFWFKHPGFQVVGSKNGTGRLDGYPGLDVQGEGNLVVAPPSVHSSGRRYEWEAAADPNEGNKIQAAPKALLDILRPPPAKTRESKGGGAPAFELPAVIGEGGRNDTLYKYASSLRGRGLDTDEIHLLVAKANNERCTPPLPLSDIDTIVKSAGRYARGPSAARRPKGDSSSASAAAPKSGEKSEASGGARDSRARGGGAGGEPPPVGGFDEFFDPEQMWPLTDTGNAERLVAKFGRDFRWCHMFNAWLFWTGTRWNVDRTGGQPIKRMAIATMREMGAICKRERIAAEKALKAEATDENRIAVAIWDSREKHAKGSENKRKLEAMVDLAKAMPDISVTPDDLDTHKHLLGVRNGVVNLRTGRLIDPEEEDLRLYLMTKQCGVAYDPAAECALFEDWLMEAMNYDTELTSFVYYGLGYTATGETNEEIFFFVQGPEGRGKGTLLNLIQLVMGDYVEVLRSESLMAKAVDQIPTDIAKLVGARVAIIDETEQQRRWNESLLKNITGNSGKITARFMRADEFSYIPNFKLWIGGNHRPKFINFDGINRRLRLIPYDVDIPKEKRNKRLKRDLEETQLPGILALMVRYARRWYEDGMPESGRVNEANEQYKWESDAIGRWIEYSCVTGPTYKCEPEKLYKSFASWCKSFNEYPVTPVIFYNELEAKGYPKAKSNGARVRRGLTIKDELTLEEKDQLEAVTSGATDDE